MDDHALALLTTSRLLASTRRVDALHGKGRSRGNLPRIDPTPPMSSTASCGSFWAAPAGGSTGPTPEESAAEPRQGVQTRPHTAVLYCPLVLPDAKAEEIRMSVRGAETSWPCRYFRAAFSTSMSLIQTVPPPPSNTRFRRIRSARCPFCKKKGV